jgi:alkanesulfonate monooxygenase SsuD/methylene tetrahydromethanopterin reductase-like flavin-dependent oxidoreductase (luciferase family)
MSARHQTHPSPQRTPVIFQAGASKDGIEFAGKHAEALYCGSLLPASTATYVKSVRAEAVKNGRDPSSIKFFAGISPIIGRTQEEAEAKFEAWRENIDVIGGLAKFSGYTNIDMSVYPLDEPFEFKGGPQENTIQGIVNNFKAGYLDNKPWTPRRLGEKMAFGGLVKGLIFLVSNNTDSKIFSVSNASRNRLNGSRCL